MTVRELMDVLANYPGDAEVKISVKAFDLAGAHLEVHPAAPRDGAAAAQPPQDSEEILPSIY